MISKDVMIDVETLGTGPLSAITDIAAVVFDPLNGKTFDTFKVKINIDSLINRGFKIEGGALRFRLEHEDYTDIFAKEHPPYHKALRMFSAFMKYTDFNCVWCNGASFDFSLLKWAYSRSLTLNQEKHLPWNFWQERDVRTIAALHPLIKKRCKFIGKPHDPVDDCMHQIKYLCQTLKKLRGK